MPGIAPGAVAIIAPIGMGFAVRYRINPVLLGLFIINGASAGGFSPISIFGSITNGVVSRNDLPGNPMLLFASSFVFNALLSAVALQTSTTVTPTSTTVTPTSTGTAELSDPPDPSALRLNRVRALTLTVLLVCGVVTFVGTMERIGTIDWLGHSVADVGAHHLGALLICCIGAVVSAFASTTGILGALIPLAVPFLLGGEVGAVGMVIALAISSSVVDSSPISTSGALVTANAPEDQRDAVFRKLMTWGLSMAAIAPPVTWVIFVVPGRL